MYQKNLIPNQKKKSDSIIGRLIADRLGWFKESTQGGKLCTIDELSIALRKS